jgi:resolvase-like protein/recombinase
MPRRSALGAKKSSCKQRCAIYTRKSTEEGLEQDFNSLDAQREACEAFISSQKHEGWVILPTQYDDGGFSGGTLERPALQRLLADIHCSKLDVVVVYKIDRLTRALLDFAKIVEVFDAHSVSFVSVTQAFNTATSMGRLTLNVLLSFAQFEREVTGERIRGNPMTRGALYHMLQNRIYRGEIVHKRHAYPGDHEPIIDECLWQEVQQALAANRFDRGASMGNHHLSLLAGLIYDAYGELMTPSHAIKKGARYRYYVSKSLLTGDKEATKRGQRIPAAYVEALVTSRIQTWLADPVAMLNAIQCCGADAVAQKRLLDEAARLAGSWQALDAERLRAVLRAVVTGIQIHCDRIDVTLDQMGIALWLDAKDQRQFAQPRGDDRERHLMVLTIPARLKRTGIEIRMVIDDGSEPANVDAVLVRLLLRAHAICARLIEEASLPLKEIAAEEGISSSYATRLLRLVFLALDIVTPILNGRNPPQLTANRLMDDTRLPLDWTAQREFLCS